MISLEQEVFDALVIASECPPEQREGTVFANLEAMREHFGPKAWDTIVKLIDENTVDGEFDVRWGNDDIGERGPILRGELKPLIHHDNIDGWSISYFSNHVVEVTPLGPGANSAGATIINF